MREHTVPQDTAELKELIVKVNADISRKFTFSKQFRKTDRQKYLALSDEIIELEAYSRDLGDELAARDDK